MIPFVLWALMIAGEFYIAALSLQKIRTKYPWFTTLVCFMAVKSLVLFYIKLNFPVPYFYAYYRSGFLISFLELGATVEVFAVMFKPYWTVPAKSLATLILATVTTLAVVAHANVKYAVSGEIGFYQSMDRVVSCSVAIALAAVLLFANYFEMPMRSRVNGISTGLFIMAVTDVVMTLVWSNFDGRVKESFAFFPVVAHYAVITLWCWFVGRREELSAIVCPQDIPSLRTALSEFRLALQVTCDSTSRKPMGKVRGEQKAKAVNNNG